MNDHARTVGIVPAAGYASRLQPLQGSKEMIDVQGRPVVQFLLDGLRLGGCQEIRVVTRQEKRDLATYADARGAKVVLARTTSVSESLLAGMHDLADDDLVLAGFPDTLWEPVDAFSQLRSRLTAPTEIVLGLFQVDLTAACDRVRLDQDGKVLGVDVKPPRPGSNLTWGCFAARVRALRGLDVPEPGLYFDSLCPGDRVVGLVLSNRYLDIGTHAGLGRLGSWFTHPRS